MSENQMFDGYPSGEATQTQSTPAPTPEPTETKPKTRSSGSKGGASMAFRGQPLAIDYNEPEFPSWEAPYEDNFVPYQGNDYRELSQINRDLIRNVNESYRIKHLLNEARQDEVEKKANYRNKYNRAMVGLSGSTAETRKAAAEIMCEDLYSEMLMASNLVEELKNNAFTIKTSIEVLNTLSNNLRAEMRIV